MQELASEQDFLDLIDRFFPEESGTLLLGRGDDCAIVSCPDSVCISTDLFLEDVHFRRKYFEPGDIGYKSLAVNVSDIAAMAARPLCFTLGLMIPKGLDGQFFSSFFRGMQSLCKQLDLPLVGGDLSRSQSLGVTITIWGSSKTGNFLTRNGVRTGDLVFAVGPLGLARVGFQTLEKERNTEKYPQAIAHFLRPAIPVAESILLGDTKIVHSLMDVSDGLAADIPRLLGPRGLELTVSESDLHPEVRSFAREEGGSAIRTALLGGEDYALLGTVTEGNASVLLQQIPGALFLGRVTDDPGIRKNGELILVDGFDHFVGGDG
ncbi:MAG: thiamine-phosphate kinase [Desulfovibrionales bacterium]